MSAFDQMRQQIAALDAEAQTRQEVLEELERDGLPLSGEHLASAQENVGRLRAQANQLRARMGEPPREYA